MIGFAVLIGMFCFTIIGVNVFCFLMMIVNLVLSVYVIDIIYMIPLSIILIHKKKISYKLYGILSLLLCIAPFVMFFVSFSANLQEDLPLTKELFGYGIKSKEHPFLAFVITSPISILSAGVFYPFITITWVSLIVGICLFVSGIRRTKKLVKEYNGDLIVTAKTKYKDYLKQVFKILIFFPLIFVNIVFIAGFLSFLFAN
jgi:hypothetical protein